MKKIKQFFIKVLEFLKPFVFYIFLGSYLFFASSYFISDNNDNTVYADDAQVEMPLNFGYELLSGYVYYYGMDNDYFYEYIPQSYYDPAVFLSYSYADNSLYEPFLIYHANPFFVADIRELYTFVVYLDIGDGDYALADVNISIGVDLVDINGNYHTVDYTQTANLNTANSSFTSDNLFLPITDYAYVNSLTEFYVTFFEVRLSWAYGSQTTENRLLWSTLTYNTSPSLDFVDYTVSTAEFLERATAHEITLAPVSRSITQFLNDFLEIEIFPNFQIKYLLLMAIIFPLVILICKLWLGG